MIGSKLTAETQIGPTMWSAEVTIGHALLLVYRNGDIRAAGTWEPGVRRVCVELEDVDVPPMVQRALEKALYDKMGGV
jgi:hypothetical protein